MKQIIYTFILIFICSIFLGCSNTIDTIPNNSDSTYIKYGTFYGMCAGYCKKDIHISQAILIFKKTANYLDSRHPDSTKSFIVPLSEYNELFNSIDFSKFQKLDSIIGCPDCHDQGGEWLEIKKNGSIKKVTLGSGDSIPEIQTFLNKIRIYFAKYKDL